MGAATEGRNEARTALRVLVVDDSRDGADTLAMLLRLWGHDARVAYDGLDGLRLARTYRPQVVLLDLSLPRLDGYHLAEVLHGKTELPQARLIAVTGLGADCYRARCAGAGFDHFLVKPVDPDELHDLLSGLARQTVAGN
jgi:two-component system CheB/CheR fusion protein